MRNFGLACVIFLVGLAVEKRLIEIRDRMVLIQVELQRIANAQDRLVTIQSTEAVKKQVEAEVVRRNQ